MKIDTDLIRDAILFADKNELRCEIRYDASEANPARDEKKTTIWLYDYKIMAGNFVSSKQELDSFYERIKQDMNRRIEEMIKKKEGL